MSKDKDNLLINLRNWANGQYENFTTEAFVHLLRYLIKNEHLVARYLLRKMINEEVDRDITEIKFNRKVDGNLNRPDIQITTHDFLVFVEVKVSAGLGSNQMEKYLNSINNSKHLNRKLILLSRYVINNPESADYISIYWYQIADWLGDYLNYQLQSPVQDTSRYLIEQFTEFLHGADLVFRPSSGNIINEIRLFFSSELGQKNDSDIMLEELKEYPMLYELLFMMDQAIDAQSQRNLYFRTRDLGESKYIGFRIQEAQYFFYILLRGREGTLKGKECSLIFMTWNCKIDAEMAIKATIGHIDKTDGRSSWQNELDLNRYQFIFQKKSKEDQFHLVGDFYKKSFEVVQKISA
jgi:hypothetical protein